MTPDQPPAPLRRADAERNRARIIAAARSAFADPLVEVSMAEVARRAGVGMATLYRNFPGRRELLEALYVDEVNAVCAAAQTLAGETPGAVFLAWIYRFFAFITSKHPVGTELLKVSGGRAPIMGESRRRVVKAGRPLLRAAQRAHEIRGDVTLEHILDLVVAITSINGDSEYLRRILDTALDGLRPR